MAQYEISFSVSPYDGAVIRQLVDRAIKIDAQNRLEGWRGIDRMSLYMDITACHANGCPLRLDALLAADDFNFMHDVFGIERHLDRDTGKLTGNFRPRFAAPRSQDEAAA